MPLYDQVINFLEDFFHQSLELVRRHKKGIAILFGFSLFIVFPILFIVVYKVSESPVMCGICHNMKPYIESWKVSSHSHVGCVQCHYEPGFINHLKGKWRDGQVSMVYFISGKYAGKYHAEISDASCLQEGCHKKSDLKDEVIFNSVKFSHSNHLEELRRGKQLRCTTCHAQIVQGEHLKVTESDCFICHFYPEENGGPLSNKISRCDICHKDVPQEINVKGRVYYHGRYEEYGIPCVRCHVNVVQGDGHVAENKCVECHSEPATTQTKFSSDFLHKNHVTDHKVECYACHSEITHKMVKVPTTVHFEKNCIVCHEESTHLGPREMYEGRGGIGVPDSPSRMYLTNVDCASCHVKEEKGDAALYSSSYSEISLGKACNRCHGEGYDKMLDRWREILYDAEDDSNKRVFEVQQILFDSDEETRRSGRLKQAQNLINEARHNLNFVLMGKGHHNVEYALKLLNVANRKVEEAKSILVPGYKPHKITRLLHGCTTLCHTEIAQKSVPFGKVDFPHEPHVIGSDLDCLACHASREEEHGKTLMKDCKSCHHGEGMGKVGCEDCHPLAAQLIRGESFGAVEATPSPKDEVVECADCHMEVAEGKETTREAMKNACIDCHEEKYGALMLDWEKQTEELLAAIQPGIEELTKAISTAERKGKNTVRARNLLKKARDREKLVREGNGVHNLEYSKKVIQAAQEMMEGIQETID
jgi:hypothetical protein